MCVLQVPGYSSTGRVPVCTTHTRVLTQVSRVLHYCSISLYITTMVVHVVASSIIILYLKI
jgi:hypothetical protein